MWSPVRDLRLSRRFSDFTSARAPRRPLCVVRQRKTHHSGWRVSSYADTESALRVQYYLDIFLYPLKQSADIYKFCYHVGGSGVWILERGGLKQPLPSPSGLQGWRRRCLVLPPSVHIKPGRPHGGGHFLRLDAHTLGCSLRKGIASLGLGFRLWIFWWNVIQKERRRSPTWRASSRPFPDVSLNC